MMKSIPTPCILLSVAAMASSALSGNDLTVTGTTTLEGPVQIDDTAGTSTTGQWNVTLENGLFIWGDSAASDSSVELNFHNGDELMLYYPKKNAFRVGKSSNTSWDEANIGQNSVVLGSGTASGFGSLAINGGYAKNPSAIAIGTNAWGSGSFALGAYGGAYGTNSVLLGGLFSEAYGDYSFAHGFGVSASGDYSTAWGSSVNALAMYVTSFGRYNIGNFDNINDGKKTWLDLDPLFEIGNGTSSSQRSNAVTIIKNGQTTLTNKYWDSASPTAVPADPDSAISGDQSSAGEALVVEGHTRFKGNVQLEQSQGDISMGVFTAQ